LHIQKIAPAYAHFSLGNAYHKKGRYDLAKEEYLKAIAADPYYPQVHLNLGVIYYENRQDEAAEKEFLKEIEINHGFESAYAFNDLGNVRVRQGRLKDAISFYQEALRIYPNYPDARINITRTYSDLGLLKVSQDSLEIALEYLGKAVELNPQEPMYRYNYGLVLGALGEEEEAINQMRRVLELDPNFKPALQVMENYDKLQKENYRKNN
jgi:tetratricopeptide (TPR) repeat protein